MALARVGATRVETASLEALGLDPAAFRLTSDEALAVAIRRGASFLCPTTPGQLVGEVMDSIRGLPSVDDVVEGRLDDLLASLVRYGDLLDLAIDELGHCKRLYLGPPAYVRRGNARLILGIRPEAAPIGSQALQDIVTFEGHLRIVRATHAEVDELLAADGLAEIALDQWLHTPRKASAQKVLELYNSRLAAAPQSQPIEELRVLDPQSDVRYYRGRWRPLLDTDQGRFVARRPQAFGADLWCFAAVVGRTVTHLVDLPVESLLASGADEAWRLQAALDSVADRPQVVHLTAVPGSVILDLFSPVPTWCQRRLDIVATPIERSRGALMSYRVAEAGLADELTFLREMLWLVCLGDVPTA